MKSSRMVSWLLLVSALVLAVVLVSAPSGQAARKKEKPRTTKPEPRAATGRSAESGDLVEQVDLGTRDVLERLKLLRVQMALDREEIAALELRMRKIELQRKFESMLGGGTAGEKTTGGRRKGPSTAGILVKAISLQPRKEAIILYRGRIYNVRPGDRVGGMTIQDITEGGLKVARSRGDSSAYVR